MKLNPLELGWIENSPMVLRAVAEQHESMALHANLAGRSTMAHDVRAEELRKEAAQIERTNGGREDG